MDNIRNKHSDGSPSARTAAQKRARDAIDVAEQVSLASGRVEELRALAESGDGEATWQLGVWYAFGRSVVANLAKDDVQARTWFERSAAARYPKGLASFGNCLLSGRGGPQDNALGLVNVTAAAELGSDVGAYTLGLAFRSGLFGLPKDKARARFWFDKAVQPECKFKHLSNRCNTNAVFFRMRKRRLTDESEE